MFSHNTGKALNSSNGSGTQLEYITTSNVYWDRFELDHLKTMPFTDDEIEKCTIQKGDLLVCEGGDIGRSAIWPFDKPIRIQNHLHRLRAYDKVKTKFYYYVLYLYKLNGNINGNGIGLQGLSSNALHAITVPVPPADEQERIVEQISQLLETVDVMDAQKDDLSSCISQAKSKILDLAIRGQLVPQNPTDEPASVLLDRIRVEKENLIKAGKIKRDKKESFIFKGEDNSYYEKIGDTIACIDEEIPFDIPNNWCWCRLGNIFNHNTGKALNSSNTAGKILTYITTSNVYWNRFELDNLKMMPFTDDEIEKCTVQKGDLLICEGGDIGRSAIWSFDEKIRIQNHIHRVRAYVAGKIEVKLYYYIFFYYKQIGKINGNGIGLQGLSSNQLHNILLPLVPSAEQQRITETIDELFTVLESMEAGLN